MSSTPTNLSDLFYLSVLYVLLSSCTTHQLWKKRIVCVIEMMLIAVVQSNSGESSLPDLNYLPLGLHVLGAVVPVRG